MLGLVSLLMGMSSAMIHGVLPAFLVTVLAASPMVIGVIEGAAEATTSFMKVFSGRASDWLGRRKPLVVAGYAISACAKLLFLGAGSALAVMLARVADRIGKGVRDGPRDALLTDVTPQPVRGTGFGLRLALYTCGAVLGPVAATAIMAASSNDFRLVFALALVPAALSVAVLWRFVREPRNAFPALGRPLAIRRADWAQLSRAFWWIVGLAALLALARFSYAFLLLKAQHSGAPTALLPAVLALIHLVYAAAAYPCGVLADRIDRRMQLGLGTLVLIGAGLLLAAVDSPALVAFGAALWGLQMGITQGLLAACIADAAPTHLRGTAFGIYDLAVGLATFSASAGAGAAWMLGGPAAAFSASAVAAGGALLLLLSGPPLTSHADSAGSR
jgi:MFS family permease